MDQKKGKIEDFFLRIKKEVPLKNYTTFKIGGPAKYFFEAKKKEEIIKAILLAKKRKLPFFILGGGSNLLVADRGYKGLVIKIQNSKFKIQNSKIYAEAGTKLSDLIKISLRESLQGLEWAAGIPKITIGGAIRGNAGAFGNSMEDIVEEAEVFDAKGEKIKIFKNRECQFDQKDSIFKKNQNLIILAAKLQLKKGKKIEIEKKIQEYLAYRQKNHPMNFPSAGSIFKNQKLKIKNQKLLKEFPLLIKFNKKGEIPAGFLIEKAGLKGLRIGQAQISKKHANFIINLGGAKAKEVIALIKIAKKKVKEKFGIALEEEIQYLG